MLYTVFSVPNNTLCIIRTTLPAAISLRAYSASNRTEYQKQKNYVAWE
jgi:hypothetical protein